MSSYTRRKMPRFEGTCVFGREPRNERRQGAEQQLSKIPTDFAQKCRRILEIVVLAARTPYMLPARSATCARLCLPSSNVRCYKCQREPKRTQLPNKETV